MTQRDGNDGAQLAKVRDSAARQAPRHRRLIRSARDGRILSALMFPFFLARPPSGFGVITTTGRKTAWVWNIRANPDVILRIRGGTFAGVARELSDPAELARARDAVCETVNLFDYGECGVHLRGLPTRAKIKELHRYWFDTGIPLVVDLVH